MGTLGDKLVYLINTKNEIRRALNERRAGLTPETPFRKYAEAIKALQSIDPLIDGSITEVRSDVTAIRQNTFRGCTSLVSADFPSLESASAYCLYNCTALKSVNLPKVKTVGDSAFYSCSSLTEIELPACERIEATAFNRCAVLGAVILSGSKVCALADTNAFSRTPIESGGGFIYVPSGLLEEYKAAENWSFYADRIRAAEDLAADDCRNQNDIRHFAD